MKRDLAHILVLCILRSAVLADTLQTQTIQLAPAWNLVAIQVAPADPRPAVVFGALGADFQAAWTYDSSTGSWQSYFRPGAPGAELNDVPAGTLTTPMAPIQVGRAYWVYANRQLSWTISGTVSAITPGVSFENGWNLIGVPVGTGQLTNQLNLLEVMAASGLEYDTILKWENGLYRKFSPRDDDINDFNAFEPTRGFWVHANLTNSVTLAPRMISSVRADVDAEPIGNFPSYEDLEVSESVPPHQRRVALGTTNQTHIVFFPGEDVQQLALANVGGGILLWQLQWQPTDRPEVSWLIMSATQGVTTIENDLVKISLDRRTLTQGTYRGTLRLVTTAGTREFQVVAHVPGVQGEWSGTAHISSVNGKQNQLPDIDLHLSFFEDPAIPGLLRGGIDSQNSLLWPVDVPLVGEILNRVGSSFLLQGAYVLPPGDQNNPPYDQFNTGASGEDVDWNCNGKLDDLNPFPFPIYRNVSLSGVLTSASPVSGYSIAGDYREVVYGMMRAPIQLRGTFSLNRSDYHPYANRRPTANESELLGTLPVVLKTDRPSFPVSLQPTTIRSLTFATDLVLQDVAVDLTFAGANFDPSELRISLVAPNNSAAVVLFDHDQVSSGRLLQVSFPANRAPKESLQTFVAAGVSTKGDWTLRIESQGNSGGSLVSWSLRLQGQPVFDISGRVTDSQRLGLPAQISLEGLPVTTVVNANADGFFVFSRVPGIPLNFTASLAGFGPADPLFPGLSPVFTTPQYSSNCLNPPALLLASKFRPLPAMPIPAAGTAGFGDYGTSNSPVSLKLQPRPDLAGSLQILATPVTGFAPLPVTFTLINASAAPASFVVWKFGDGTAATNLASSSLEHLYATSGPSGYSVTAELLGVVTGTISTTVYPQPSPHNSSYAANFFLPRFTSGGAVPLNLNSLNSTASTPQLADLVQVQHAYSASFDIDLAPSIATNASGIGQFFSDGFDSTGVLRQNQDNLANNFRLEDYKYVVEQGDLPSQWTSAGECGVALDDGQFDSFPKQGSSPSSDCAQPRYLVACNLGPQIIMPSDAEVYPLGAADASHPSGIFANLPLVPGPDPLLSPGRDGVARSRELQLVVGPLAEYWNTGGPR